LCVLREEVMQIKEATITIGRKGDQVIQGRIIQMADTGIIQMADGRKGDQLMDPIRAVMGIVQTELVDRMVVKTGGSAYCRAKYNHSND